MTQQLIRLNDKHISINQMKMSVDRVLQCFIRNITSPPSLLIETYLREAGFWHMANIGQGCKLDSKLISTFVERWRLETHTFYLPCKECTITLEDVQLQFGLPVDGSVLTGSTQSIDWGAICYDLLGAISYIIYRGWIDMGWLRDTFLESRDDSTEIQRQLANLVGGLSCCRHCTGRRVRRRNQIKLKSEVASHYYNHGLGFTFHFYVLEWTTVFIPTLNKVEPFAEYKGIPISLEDIRLLLDQRSEAHITVQEVIPDEFLQNPNIWHVRVPLVNYATVDMH
ncbi:hypothetical protein CXB51_003792 [Gossypium anomalum]|uniref:Aminotransferase-like plant mobile domain-containing protein n=1 Tax=Gossypium anomalum TaxID=47600 RepID=A0A8J5Z2Q1_9ROSI|nr:hypothetical protein CXB51_003792 [Gossypium anomalum]